MDATNFVETISQLVPNKQDILRNTTCSEEFADIYRSYLLLVDYQYYAL